MKKLVIIGDRYGSLLRTEDTFLYNKYKNQPNVFVFELNNEKKLYYVVAGKQHSINITKIQLAKPFEEVYYEDFQKLIELTGRETIKEMWLE